MKTETLRSYTEHLCTLLRLPPSKQAEINAAEHLETLQSELDRLRQQLAERWTASDTDYDRSIHHNPDAAVWADLFMQTFPNCGADRDIMLGWFASAIMSMYDAKVAPIEHERDRIADDYERAMHRVGRLEAQLAGRGEPDEVFNIIEGVRAEITSPFWRTAESRDRVMGWMSRMHRLLSAAPSVGEAQGDLVDQFRAKSPEHDRAYREEKAKVDEAEFAAWLCEQMPAGTVIADPKWWAPRIWREAQRGGG